MPGRNQCQITEHGCVPLPEWNVQFWQYVEARVSLFSPQFPPEEGFSSVCSLSWAGPPLGDRIAQNSLALWQTRTDQDWLGLPTGAGRTGKRSQQSVSQSVPVRDKSWVILAGGLSQCLRTSQSSLLTQPPLNSRMIKTWVSVTVSSTIQYNTSREITYIKTCHFFKREKQRKVFLAKIK